MQFDLTKEFIDQIIIALEKEDSKFIADAILPLHPADIAEILELIDLKGAQFLYRLLDEELASEVLVEIEEDTRDQFLASFSSEEIADSVNKMDADDATDIIQDLPEEVQEQVLNVLKDNDQSSDISMLMNYDENSAGGIMDVDFVAANWNWTVKDALNKLREQVENVDQIYTIYVVDSTKKFKGILSLKRFLYAKDDTLIKDIYRKDSISVLDIEEAESVASKMEKYDLVVIPVLSEDKKLLGRITIDDALDVIKEEAEKDYQMASGISEKVESSDSLFVISRARLPWLLIGLLGGILGAYVIGFFEEHLRENAVMASFIPLILAMGGNVGVQSSAIIVQSLANNTLNYESIFKRLLKELTVALFNGFICAIIALIFCWITRSDFALALTIGVSLVAVFTYAGLFGTFVPLILNKYKIDPALATGPFITTTNDIIGLLIYFLIGMALYF
ncbi:MAG: magnesium transporter [Flavobacteriales bacterium]|jgi:magnesium transporter|nr:magnesium transporter [Flavobacteriales bacterium]MDG1440980.1 magnesium transporter [Flavobacteriales bacterium]MDG1798767.1 magnesium transporter [Flavobacteriales bacterium]